MFHFKQFSVDQTGCAMKINTDGVLLGALVEDAAAKSILDIGTGTGVISLMLAQRFPFANIDAVEIDESAASTADRNFKNSPFESRLRLFSIGFEQFFNEHTDKKYDLIISNPPFYINSLTSPKKSVNVAKHADVTFFKMMVGLSSAHLTKNGSLWLILPLQTGEMLLNFVEEFNLHPQKSVSIRSFGTDIPHREIIKFGFEKYNAEKTNLVIYNSTGIYTDTYKQLLKPFFINF